MLIEINIVDKHPTVIGSPVIICGNSGYTIDFDFDDEWGDIAYKTARFVYVQNGEVKYQDVPFGTEPCPVPILANTKEVRVGVYAGDLKTTTPAVIPCARSILCGTDQIEEGPTENQYNQIMELLNAEGIGYLTTHKQNKVSWLRDGDIAAMWLGTYKGVEDEDPEGEYPEGGGGGGGEGSVAPLIVTLSEDGWLASHDPISIKEYVESGVDVYLQVGSAYFALSYVAELYAYFTAIYDNGFVDVYRVEPGANVRHYNHSFALTEEGKAEIVADVIAALPVYNGEVV